MMGKSKSNSNRSSFDYGRSAIFAQDHSICRVLTMTSSEEQLC
jgi:hypothetical protein